MSVVRLAGRSVAAFAAVALVQAACGEPTTRSDAPTTPGTMLAGGTTVASAPNTISAPPTAPPPTARPQPTHACEDDGPLHEGAQFAFVGEVSRISAAVDSWDVDVENPDRPDTPPQKQWVEFAVESWRLGDWGDVFHAWVPRHRIDIGQRVAVAGDARHVDIDGFSGQSGEVQLCRVLPGSEAPDWASLLDIVAASTLPDPGGSVPSSSPAPDAAPRVDDAVVRALADRIGLDASIESRDGEHGPGQCVDRLEPRTLCVNVPLWGLWQYADLAAGEGAGLDRVATTELAASWFADLGLDPGPVATVVPNGPLLEIEYMSGARAIVSDLGMVLVIAPTILLDQLRPGFASQPALEDGAEPGL